MKKILFSFLFSFLSIYSNVDFPVIVERALSYDDVLLIPQRSDIVSRKNVSTKTKLTKNITLNIPIVSANMDTVTEAEMAITMAQLGGIGIIHRFNSIEDQVREVLRVKRYRNAIIENPVTVNQDATLEQAKEIMNENDITGLLVVDNNKKLTGILTSRDVHLSTLNTDNVKDLMTPKTRLIIGRPDIDIKEAQEILFKNRIEKLPLVDLDWNIAGLITRKDLLQKRQFPFSTIDDKDRLMVGAAIGVNEDALDRAEALINVGVDILVIDIAHGHSLLAIEVLKKIKNSFPNIDIIAGNVATAHGVHDLIQAGADAIKVGVGPGSICTTRITTGCGYPQLSAIIHCYQEARKNNVPIIADGGIKVSGDITKAIAAGASTVMLGNLLAGTDESPGNTIIKNGKKYKIIRGMASFGAHLGRTARTSKNSKDDKDDYVPEGVEALTPYKGSVNEIVSQLLGGFRSGMSYCGTPSLDELCGKGQFIQITSAGMRESRPHDIETI